MKVVKKTLDTIQRCYCAGHVTVDGVTRAVLASEANGGPCYAYFGEDFSERETVWERAGGTMSFVELPQKNGEFLAVQNFFPGFQSEHAKIVHGRYIDGAWQVRDFVHLPYVHRFDVLESEGRLYLLAATLCGSKRDREDWGDPGALWVGELPEDMGGGITLVKIKDFLLKNHGYSRCEEGGRQFGMVTCDSGIYRVVPPQNGADWQVEQLLADRISDVAAFDLDGDGELELATLSPFHGNELAIRKKMDARRYETVYKYPDDLEFAHAVWAGELFGSPVVFFGNRHGECVLGYIARDTVTGEYYSDIIERGVGTANIDVVKKGDEAWLIAANHTRNEAAVYVLLPD